MSRTSRTTPRTLTALAAAALLTVLAACSGGGDPAESETTADPTTEDTTTETIDEETPEAEAPGIEQDGPVRIGVVGASDEQWKIFEQAAAAAGIEVEVIDFTDYQQPNPATTQGQLELNQFQHLKFLAEYNVAAGEDLVPIAATAVYPLGLYSKQYTDLSEFQQGDEIAIPNDPSNLARGLLVLQDAGLVELRDGGSPYSTEADVLETSLVTVTPVDAAQTPIALNSVAASIINNDFVADAGLEPSDALYQDDAASDAARPYINVWAARADDQDNPLYALIIEVFKTQEVQDALLAGSGGTAVLANQSAAELQGYLADIQDAILAGQG